MGNFLLLLKKDLLEFTRGKKWLIYLISFSLITVLSVITARILPELMNEILADADMGMFFEYEISVADSYAQFSANMGEIAGLLIAVMFANTFSKEKNSGTYYMLKSNGVNETKIVMSHFVSKLILISLSYIVSLLLFVPLNLVLFKQYTGLRGVIALSYVYLVLIFALSLGLFISSIVNKKSKGYVIVIVVYFLLMLLSSFPHIDIYNPMNGLNLANEIIFQDEIVLSDYLINLFVTLGVIVAFIIGSIYCFKNKIDNRK